MGLLSSLGLLLLPLVSRSRSTSVAVPIDSETSRLKAELEKSQVEIDRLRIDILMWMDIADDWRRRAERVQMPTMSVHQVSEAMRLQMQAQMQTAQMRASSALAQQNQLGQQAQQTSQWYHCDCTPLHGRAGYLLDGRNY